MTSIVTRLIGVELALCLWSMTAGSTSAAGPAAVAGSSASTDAAIVATATLSASVGTDLRFFGTDVAAEGDVIAVGAPHVTIPGITRPGGVYVYERPSGGWIEQPGESAVLVTSLPLDRGGEFGTSIDMSGDVIVVGEPRVLREGGVQRDYSRAFVYVKPATGWSGVLTESAVLRVRHQTGDGQNGARASLFGQSVAISGDTIVGGDSASGAAYLFKKPAAGWTGTIFESARLMDPSPPDPNHTFAQNVVIDGTTVVVSASDFVAEEYHGSGVVFTKPASGWRGDLTASAVLAGGAGAEASRLNSMDIRGDTIAIGVLNFVFGAVVFVRPPGGWVDAGATAHLAASELGLGVAVASSSTVLMAGGRIGSRPGGTVSVFRRPATGWSGEVGPRQRVIFNAGYTTFGIDIRAVAVDGTTIAIGLPGNTFLQNDGRVFVAER